MVWFDWVREHKDTIFNISTVAVPLLLLVIIGWRSYRKRHAVVWGIRLLLFPAGNASGRCYIRGTLYRFTIAAGQRGLDAAFNPEPTNVMSADIQNAQRAIDVKFVRAVRRKEKRDKRRKKG